MMSDETTADPVRDKSRWCEFCCWVDPRHACTVIAMTPEEEAEVLRELNSVNLERPAANIHPSDPGDGSMAWYCGVVEWRTAGGWAVRVFNDCGEWDYLEEVEAPDGRAWRYPCGDDGAEPWHAMTERVAGWTPIPPSGYTVDATHARLAAWPGSEHLDPDAREIE